MSLFIKNNGIYEISFIKKEAKDFSNKEIQDEICKGANLKELYEISLRILPKLNISNENIKYYSSLAQYYTIYKLQRMNKNTAFFYLICFINFKYRKINDNIINSFIYKVNQQVMNSIRYGKESVYDAKTQCRKR